MKVGILTFPNSTSYGATLQMYALYHTVKSLGHDTEVINYYSKFMKAEKHIHQGKSGKTLRASLKRRAAKAIHFRLERAFRHFEKNNMTLYPKRPFVDKSRLSDVGKRYDAVICGSDQVWNPHITDADLSYFLDFCTESTRRISYAPSFGIDTFSKEFGEMIRPSIVAFNALSVREKVGGDYVMREFGLNASIVCDPTMLLTADEWTGIEHKYPVSPNSYILFYTIRKSERLMNYCRRLSKETGLKIVVVGGNIFSNIKRRDKDIEYATDISPEQWLYLVHNAACVVTNSFHGSAFSIIYHKNFYVELSSATNSRLSNITNVLGLQSRVVDHKECEDLGDCNYSIADIELPKIRMESLAFLKNALQVDKNE